MQIPPEQGQLMALLVQLIGAKRTIEIGVFTGYSTLCVAQALPDDSYTVACDVDENWTAIARRYWQEAGVNHKIDLRLAATADTLQSLLDEGQAGRFDFAFIDADKAAYDTYYEQCLRLLRPGGLIAIDNVLMFGQVVDEAVRGDAVPDIFPADDVAAMRALNLKIRDDQRVDLSMLAIYDGISLVRKR